MADSNTENTKPENKKKTIFSSANILLGTCILCVAMFKISMLIFEKPRIMTMKCFHLHEDAKYYFPAIQLQPNMYNFSNIHYVETPRTATVFNNLRINHFPARKLTFAWRGRTPSKNVFTSTYLGTKQETHIEVIPTGDGLQWNQLSE